MIRRLFVAVEFDREFQEMLADVLSQLHNNGVKGRYERVANLHVTLAFIGETERLDDIKRAIGQITFSPFDIAPGDFGIFDRHGVLWLGLTNEKALKALAGSVRGKLDEIGVQYSAKPFVPHITLVKDASFDSGGMDFDVDFLPATMRVAKISVMETVYEKGIRKYIER